MTTKNQKPRIEAAFAIGSPARSSAYKTCSRCKGTGWWQLGRVCAKCGGRGHAERSTLATKIRDKKVHIAEVRGIIAEDYRRLVSPARTFGRQQIADRIEREQENLAKLERELAVLEASS